MQKIGIDPGLDGAIAFVDDDEIALYDMPIKVCHWKKPKKNKVGNLVYKMMVDSAKLRDIILENYIPGATFSIEVVSSMHKQGVASSFTFGGSFYSVIAVVECLGVLPKMVRPQAWKSKCGLIGMDKDASRILALKMYPHLGDLLKRKKDVDRADALFIAIS